MNENKSYIGWIVALIVVLGLGYLIMAQKPVNAPAHTDSSATTTSDAMKPGEDTITIGWIGPLTGDAASIGVPAQKGAALAVEEINAAGGIGGKKVILASEDGKCDGKEGATAVEKLINVTKVKAVIGGFCSGETLGATPIANENHVVMISGTASSPDLTTKGGKFFFRLYPSDALAGQVAAKYAMDKLGAKTAAVITENNDYAQGLHHVFVDSFTKAGGKVSVDEVFNTGVTDFRTQALKIKNAKVDVVYIVPGSGVTPGVSIIKALKDQKIASKLLTAEILLDKEVAQNNADTMAGVVGFTAFYDTTYSPAQKVMTAYKARYNEDMPYPFFTINNYSGAYLLKNLIEKNGYDGDKLQAALSTLTDWTGGALAHVTLHGSDIDWKSFNIKGFQDGKLVDNGVFSF